MKNKKLNETNNIKLILSNKKDSKEGKKIDYHSLSRAKAKAMTWVASAGSRPRLKTKRVKRAVSGVEYVQFL